MVSSTVCSFQILADAMKANDRKAAFDVLWEIESFPLYVEAAKEEAAREDAGDEKEKKRSSKDKDKKKSKV